jgi:hypothetical protein
LSGAKHNRSGGLVLRKQKRHASHNGGACRFAFPVEVPGDSVWGARLIRADGFSADGQKDNAGRFEDGYLKT